MYIPRIFPIFPLALSLLSCSSSGNDSPIDPLPETPQAGISFGGKGGTWQDAQTSRATATGLETLHSSFRVWGYKTTDNEQETTQVVMDGYNVVHTGAANATTSNTDGWEYVGIANPNLAASQTIKYWDYSATSYRFLGYSPADANITTYDNSADAAEPAMAMGYGYAYSDDATDASLPYLTELWYGSNHDATQGYGKCVTMTFVPVIAKVRFKFSYPDGTTSIDIKNISFGDTRFASNHAAADTPLRGTIAATYPLSGTPQSAMPQLSWTPATDNPTGSLILSVPYEQDGDPIHILTDESQYEKWYYVPPLDIIPYKQGAYMMSATINGNNASAAVPAEFMQWKAGYQYTYIFKITEAGTMISFVDMQVEQWLTGSNVDNRGTGTEGW